MTRVIQCDVCGKVAESTISFATFSIDPYRLKSVIEEVDKEACSPACMAKLLRETADKLAPRNTFDESSGITEKPRVTTERHEAMFCEHANE